MTFLGFLSPSRLSGNSGGADIRSPCLPSRENQTVPDVDEGTYLCSRLHCSCHYRWCLRYYFETQAVMMDQWDTAAIVQSTWNQDQIHPGVGTLRTSRMMGNVYRCRSDTYVEAITIYCLKKKEKPKQTGNCPWWKNVLSLQQRTAK